MACWAAAFTGALLTSVANVSGPGFPAAHAQTSGATTQNAGASAVSEPPLTQAGRQARRQRLSADAENIAQERANLNRRLIEVAKRVQDSESQLTELEGRLSELAEQRKLILGSLTRENRSIAKLLAALQRMGRNPPPVIITQRDDALSMVRSAMMLARVFPELKGRADVLSAQLSELTRVAEQIKAASRTLRAETDALRESQTNLSALVAEKQQRFVVIRRELASLEQVSARQSTASDSVETLIGNLRTAIDPQTGAAQYDEALGAQDNETDANGARQVAALPDGAIVEPPTETFTSTPPDDSTLTGEPVETLAPDPSQTVSPTRKPLPQADQDEAGGAGPVEVGPRGGVQVALNDLKRIEPAVPFVKTKGLLNLPASGRRLWGFGENTPDGSESQGLALETRYNAQITSPADGWVVHAGPFLSYRELLIINAGGGYHILIAGMQQRDVRVGQFVLAGEPVGRMARKAETATDIKDDLPIVYLEFRRKGKPINPDPWWARETRKVQG